MLNHPCTGKWNTCCDVACDSTNESKACRSSCETHGIQQRWLLDHECQWYIAEPFCDSYLGNRCNHQHTSFLMDVLMHSMNRSLVFSGFKERSQVAKGFLTKVHHFEMFGIWCPSKFAVSLPYLQCRWNVATYMDMFLLKYRRRFCKSHLYASMNLGKMFKPNLLVVCLSLSKKLQKYGDRPNQCFHLFGP